MFEQAVVHMIVCSQGILNTIEVVIFEGCIFSQNGSHFPFNFMNGC